MRFAGRHIGPRPEDLPQMLSAAGYDDMEALLAASVPAGIRLRDDLDLPAALGEAEALAALEEYASQNEVLRSYLGCGYHACLLPAVIRRNVLENPGWYTQYTPYQAEISQGRLEALLAFQTMVAELTGLEVANASLLDEATAAAEAMAMAHRVTRKSGGERFLVAADCHPHTLGVLATRAQPLGIEVAVGQVEEFELGEGVFGLIVQNPATDGRVRDLMDLHTRARAAGVVTIEATDLLALAAMRPPGEAGADVAVGNAQRFGVPLGFGGPHAAFFATRSEYARRVPGRVVGVSRDAAGRPAYRLALQTREQHIRRERATSNICTAQVLLAIMSAFYAIWHGPEGLTAIARRVKRMAEALRAGLGELGLAVATWPIFDTVLVEAGAERDGVLDRARRLGMNFRPHGDVGVVVALDETVGESDLADVLAAFSGGEGAGAAAVAAAAPDRFEPPLHREGQCLMHPLFGAVRSEHEMLRYLHRLQGRDLSLTTSMIPLGSCTMKLNAAAEILPVTWPGFSDLHPLAPLDQARGYSRLFADLERWLAELTGMAAVSLQPNAGSQGEYAGLLAIQAWQRDRGEGQRDVCLIPSSAHGTNPASAVLAGMRVVPVALDEAGDVDLEDLAAKAAEHSERLAAVMVTYPSTFGVFEEGIRDLAATVHGQGGQVYLDGANLNAQVGLARPGDYGADVCHLNLHKTFCIPHGGGGPGMGPIAVAPHLAPYLPGHPFAEVGGEQATGPVSAAPWGSAGILPISWMYLRMMGPDGLREASEVAVLSANYLAARLAPHFPVLYRGARGAVAHEFVLDLRPLQKATGVNVGDVAKRLMDYGFHAPTVSFPVAGTLMIEPTESESLAELDRFVAALAGIREEIREIEDGRADRENNLLKGAPHTAQAVAADDWPHPYSRERAAYPADWLRQDKFWPSVARVDEVYGDRNFSCVCPPVEAYGA